MTADNPRPAVAATRRTSKVANKVTLDYTQVGGELSSALWSVYVKIRRPEGEATLQGVKVEAKSDTGELKVVKKTNKNKAIFDDTQSWKALDENEKHLRALLARYVTTDLNRGSYLIHALNVAKFRLEISGLIEKRVKLVQTLLENWEEEVLPQVQKDYPEHYETLYQSGALAAPAPDQFDVLVFLQPLGTTAADRELDLTNLDDTQKMQVLSNMEADAKRMAKVRLGNLYDQVFGEVLDLCEEVNKGQFETGTARTGTLTRIMEVLERCKNFGNLTSRETVAKLTTAIDTLKDVTYQDLNQNKGHIREALRKVIAPLKEDIKAIHPTYEARAERTIE